MSDIALKTQSQERLRINIIGKSNGVGLARDLDLLRDALVRLGMQVQVIAVDRNDAARRRSVWVQFLTLLHMRRRDRAMPKADINLMLEHVWIPYLKDARTNIGIPNPEWFDRRDQRFMRFLDHVWAKTGYTEQVFRSLSCATTHIGFDSFDRFDGSVAKKRQYFHLAGKSTMKGTERLVSVWERHPQWPSLVIVQHRPPEKSCSATNISFRCGYMDDEELKRLQNESLFHLCLSRTEGWGHYIVEALSTAAVTVTVDAAPMNELVTTERGVLVPYDATGMQKLARTHEFDEAGFERAIARTLQMTDEECDAVGQAARAWFVANKEAFPARIAAALAGVSRT